MRKQMIEMDTVYYRYIKLHYDSNISVFKFKKTKLGFGNKLSAMPLRDFIISMKWKFVSTTLHKCHFFSWIWFRNKNKINVQNWHKEYRWFKEPFP